MKTMALSKVDTGLREQEVVNLRWDWEVKVPGLAASVFVIPRADHWLRNVMTLVNCCLLSVAASAKCSRQAVSEKVPLSSGACKFRNRNPLQVTASHVNKRLATIAQDGTIQPDDY